MAQAAAWKECEYCGLEITKDLKIVTVGTSGGIIGGPVPKKCSSNTGNHKFVRIIGMKCRKIVTFNLVFFFCFIFTCFYFLFSFLTVFFVFFFVLFTLLTIGYY